MSSSNTAGRLAQFRAAIGSKVRDLRHHRRLSQAELAERLHLTQSTLSKVERGLTSLTAEQFLLLLSIFNLPSTYFVGRGFDETSELQNTLARLGAGHLVEREDLLPSERLRDVNGVIREALIVGTPRLLTALGPVIVRNVDHTNLAKIYAQLAEVGLERRLAWVVENVLIALHRVRIDSLPRDASAQYRRAAVVLESFLDGVRSRVTDDRDHLTAPPDNLMNHIRSRRTYEEVVEASSESSRRWRIVTDLEPNDFVSALKEAYGPR